MCNQFTLHHKIRINTRRTNFGQGKTDSILYGCESYEQGTQRSVWNWLERTTSCNVQAEKSGKDIKTRCIGSIYNLLNRKDLSSIKQVRTQSSFTTHSKLIVSWKQLWWNLKKSYTRKFMRHFDLLQRFPLKIIGWKNLIQKLLEVVKTPNKSNQNQNTQLSRTVRLVSEPPSGLLTQEIRKDVYKLKNGETCEWTTIQLELCASVYCTCR